MKKMVWVAFLLSAMMLAITLYLYPSLPDRIPMHWNAAGEIDEHMNKAFIFLLPVVFALSFMVILLQQSFAFRAENYKRIQKPLRIVQLILPTIFAVLWVLTLIASYHPEKLNMSFVITFLLGLMMAVIGNLMPKIKANSFVGIRTTWTSSDPIVWYKTHRFGGKLWFIGGIACMLCALLFPTDWIFICYTTIPLFMAVVPIVYSYVCYRQLKQEELK